MFQEKNEKKSHKIKNSVFFQLVSKMSQIKKYTYFVFCCISDTKSSVFRNFITIYSIYNHMYN